jgi:hypothetical protein
MTRKLLIAAALLIALVPFLGFSYSVQVILTTTLALFSAVTLFFSRKPRMRSSSSGGANNPTESAPYMPHVQKESAPSIYSGDGATASPRSLAVHHEEVDVAHHISSDLPTHPIAPRPRRRKAAPVVLPDLAAQPVATPEDSHAEAPRGEGLSEVSRIPSPRPRRARPIKSMIADEDPIRPADAVIPASELAREHADFYSGK